MDDASVALLAGLLPLLPVAMVVADDAVVPAPCSEGDFDTALNDVQTTGGGTLTFDCGGPVVIPITAQKVIDSDVTIIGDGQVTFEGDGDNRLFRVADGASLELDGLTLENGNSSGAGGAITVSGSGTLTITTSTFDNNSADSGGAINVNGGGGSKTTAR